MRAQVEVEVAFRDFVREFGGEVVEDLVPKSPDFQNADFLFRDCGVVAELKRLVENKAEDAQLQAKIQTKFDRWMDNGTIPPVYGTVRIESRTLPESCQREMIDVYRPPIQRRILKANKQIKATLKRFRIESGKGLLILVNDGNYALEADAVLYLVGRVLGTKFQWVNSVVYCTVNMFASSPLTTKATLVWVHAIREGVSSVDDAFVMGLYRGWSTYLEKLTGEPVETIQVNDATVLERIKYVTRS
jgi:hypothetical protein